MKRAAIAATLLALVFAACGGDGGGGASSEDRAAASTPAPTAAAEGASVEIKSFIFNPDPITVKAGETVTFTNSDATVHTVTAGTRKRPDKAAFNASIGEGEDFKQTFDKPGEYAYFCDLHSGGGMVGKVIVK